MFFRASNGMSRTAPKTSLSMSVLFKPRYKQQFIKFQAHIGKKLKIQLPVSSNPEITFYQWSKLIPLDATCSSEPPTSFGSPNFIENDEFSFSDLTDILPRMKRCAIANNNKNLIFTDILRSHRGIYELSIRNSVGKTDAYFSIDVICMQKKSAVH